MVLYGKLYVGGRDAQIDGAHWARLPSLRAKGHDDENNEYGDSGYGNARGDMGGVVLAGVSAVHGFLCDTDHDRWGRRRLGGRTGYLCRNNQGFVLLGIPGNGCVIRAAFREPAVFF